MANRAVAAGGDGAPVSYLGAIVLLGDDPRTFSKYMLNVLADFKPEEAPIRPEAAALSEPRAKSLAKDHPASHCLPLGITQAEGIGYPFPFKIVQMPGLILVLYEADGTHRQIYTDGRRDFGHMDLQITIEDPKMYTRPFTIKYTQRLLPDTDILESICAENEKDRTHLDSR